MILSKFERKAKRVLPTSTDNMKQSKSQQLGEGIFARLPAKDLTWPLSKEKTMELIGRLERYKGIFMLALSADSMYVSMPYKYWVAIDGIFPLGLGSDTFSTVWIPQITD